MLDKSLAKYNHKVIQCLDQVIGDTLDMDAITMLELMRYKEEVKIVKKPVKYVVDIEVQTMHD